MAAMLTRTRCFTPAATAAPQRRVLVVRASSQPVQKQQQKAAPQLVKPAIALAISNVIAALPAAAEGGKLFDCELLSIN